MPTREPPTILLLGWEPITLSQLHIGLEDAGYAVQTAQRLDDGLARLRCAAPDLIVLDVQTADPAHAPWQIGRILRKATTCPLVILLPENAQAQAVEALRLGADDCLARPFHLRELIARIQRIIWRVTETAPWPAARPRLSLNPSNQTVLLDGEVIHLTPTEFKLLSVLYAHAGEPLSYAQIQQAMWGQPDPEPGSRLKLFIWQLRRKLEANPRLPRLILTEPGVGYRLCLDHDA